MRAKAIAIPASALAAACLLAWGVGACIPYVTAPKSEAWNSSSVPDHLAVVFFGEDADTSTCEYTYSSVQGGLTRFSMSHKLSQGWGHVSVREKVSGTHLVDTRVDPGFGPNVLDDFVDLAAAGEYLVKVETHDAVGQLSVNLDYVTTRVGFSWNAQFPDVYDPAPARTETYTWFCPTGATPDLEIRASMPFGTVTFEIRDSGGALVRPADTFNGNGLGGAQQVLTVANLSGASGQWTIKIDLGAMGDDTSLSFKLTLP